MSGPQRTIRLIEDSHAPELFADSVTAVHLVNEQIVVTFETWHRRCDDYTSPEGGEPERRVAFRVRIPVGTSVAAARFFLSQAEYVQQVRAHIVVPEDGEAKPVN